MKQATMTQHADILKRLRHQQAASERGEPSSYVIDIWRCAADEIERLRANLRLAGEKFVEVMDENERLRAALSALKPATQEKA